jgi:TolB-like protein
MMLNTQPSEIHYWKPEAAMEENFAFSRQELVCEQAENTSRNAVLGALNKVLESNEFRQSIRLSRFLRFTVEQMLQGCGSNLKEYTIATEVYGRKADFDPAQDTIVRSEARRLRRKLDDYYQREGQSDDIIICFRPGSYVPSTRRKSTLETPSSSITQKLKPVTCPFRGEMLVVVKPMLSPAGDNQASALALELSDEIILKLMRTPGIRVARSSFGEQQQSIAEVAAAKITIDGTVRTAKDQIGVTVRASSGGGLVLWSQRFDTFSKLDESIGLCEAVASATVTRLSPAGALPGGCVTHDAYLAYAEALAAESLIETASIPSISMALERFEALAARVPGYARAYSGIAQCCILLIESGFGCWRELAAKGKRACFTALSLDSGEARAHSALGCFAAQEWDWKRAEECFRAALRLEPQSITHRHLSQFLLARGRFEESWQHLQLAGKIDPFSMQQRLLEARSFCCSHLSQTPDHHYNWIKEEGPVPIELMLLRASSEKRRSGGLKTRAIPEWIQDSCLSDGPTCIASLAEMFSLHHAEDKARVLIAKAGLIQEGSSISRFRQALLAFSVQDRPLGLRLLVDSWQNREPELYWLSVDPRFDHIRDTDEYIAIRNALFHDEMVASATTVL